MVSLAHVTQITRTVGAYGARHNLISWCPARAVKAGDRVAQLILECIVTPDVAEVENLDDTVRGAGGYGSTGTA